MTPESTADGATIDGWSCPAPLRDQPNIVMGHGGGGKLSAELVEHLFLPAFNNEHLEDLGDAAVVELPGGRIAMSTDSFVIRPRIFPGGDIGELAVNGTVNDVAMTGATPLYVSVAMILEEGMPIDELAAISRSMAKAADQAGVQLVTGDTKVVDRGHGDGVYINTTGLGVLRDGVDIRPQNAEPGDAILVNGTIGDHGMAIMSVREGLEFDPEGSVLQLESGDRNVCLRLERRDEGSGSLANTRWTLLDVRVGPLGEVAHVDGFADLCWYSSHHNFLDWGHVWTGGTRHDLKLNHDGHSGEWTYTLYTIEQGPLESGVCAPLADGQGPIGPAISLFPVTP